MVLLGMPTVAAIETSTLFVIILVLISAAAISIRHNPNGRSLRYRRRRVANWLALGFTCTLPLHRQFCEKSNAFLFALTVSPIIISRPDNCFYAARYAMTVANIPSIRAAIGVSHAGFGLVLTCGFWSYAVFTVINGYLLDTIGGRKGLFVGTLGCSAATLLNGAHSPADDFCFCSAGCACTGVPYSALLSVARLRPASRRAFRY